MRQPPHTVACSAASRAALTRAVVAVSRPKPPDRQGGGGGARGQKQDCVPKFGFFNGLPLVADECSSDFGGWVGYGLPGPQMTPLPPGGGGGGSEQWPGPVCGRVRHPPA